MRNKVKSINTHSQEVEYSFPAVIPKSGTAVLLHLTQVRI